MANPKYLIPVGVAAALLTASPAPASAAITGTSFYCTSGSVTSLHPGYQFESGATVLWWIPEYFRWDGQQWQSYAFGQYHYNTSGGVADAWRAYPDGSPSAQQSLARATGYFAVRTWVHAEGRWHAEWATNARNVAPQPSYWCQA